MNPYFGQNGIQFIGVFFKRFYFLVTGKIAFSELATDEVQFCVLSLIAVSCSLIGVFLVLKKMTMLANSLSHTILPGLVIAFLLSGSISSQASGSLSSINMHTLLLAALITALITTFTTQLFHRVFKLQEDASIGLVCTTMVAIGVVLVTVYTRNTHLGIEAVMGNVDALHLDDVQSALWIGLINLVVITCFFKELKLTAFDPGFASTQGFSERGWSYLLMLLTSLTVIGAFRAVGILLVLSFLVGPVITARLFTHRLKVLIVLAIAIGIAASFISVALSRHMLSIYRLPLSTAGIVSTLLGFIYFCALGIQKLQQTGRLKGILAKDA